MSYILLMIFVAIVATAIAVVPAIWILWRDAHQPSPIAVVRRVPVSTQGAQSRPAGRPAMAPMTMSAVTA